MVIWARVEPKASVSRLAEGDAEIKDTMVNHFVEPLYVSGGSVQVVFRIGRWSTLRSQVWSTQ